jgi:hypothetical protein
MKKVFLESSILLDLILYNNKPDHVNYKYLFNYLSTPIHIIIVNNIELTLDNQLNN